MSCKTVSRRLDQLRSREWPTWTRSSIGRSWRSCDGISVEADDLPGHNEPSFGAQMDPELVHDDVEELSADGSSDVEGPVDRAAFV